MTVENESLKDRMARVRSFRKASVAVRTITPEEAFVAQSKGDVMTRERHRGLTEDDPSENGVVTTHTRPGVVLMWKPGQDGRYVPRMVSETSTRLNLDNGWLIKCPDCGTNHEQSNLPVTDPNSCPARDPVAVRVCPVCGKRIFDNMGFERMDDGDDPNVLKDESYENSTPASRTRVQLNIHLWTRHPRQAQMMNIGPLPQAFADMTNQDRVV